VCLGEVGAVFGLEVSRLARSNADLSRLLELALCLPRMPSALLRTESPAVATNRVWLGCHPARSVLVTTR
jgi:hypothetical protein